MAFLRARVVCGRYSLNAPVAVAPGSACSGEPIWKTDASYMNSSSASPSSWSHPSDSGSMAAATNSARAAIRSPLPVWRRSPLSSLVPVSESEPTHRCLQAQTKREPLQACSHTRQADGGRLPSLSSLQGA